VLAGDKTIKKKSEGNRLLMQQSKKKQGGVGKMASQNDHRCATSHTRKTYNAINAEHYALFSSVFFYAFFFWSQFIVHHDNL
jgi:hypothetical protein